MKVTRLTPGDERLACQAVASLKAKEEGLGHSPEVPFMTGFLAQTSNYLFVAHEQETPVAFALGYALPRVDRAESMLYLHEVEVVESRRGEGIGKRLMQEVLRLCDKQGFCELFLITESDNVPARRLYQGIGAEEEVGAILAWYEFADSRTAWREK